MKGKKVALYRGMSVHKADGYKMTDTSNGKKKNKKSTTSLKMCQRYCSQT